MKHITVGMVAHVDAGKTTLSENLLYMGGKIRKMGRVDNGDSFFDGNVMERERGITIFSKQAIIKTDKVTITLLDTPGHRDFSAEMERTLQVLDYAVLVISAADGVTGYTETLWKLLKTYRVPVFIFVNKMDMPGTDRKEILKNLKDRLDGDIADFTTDRKEMHQEAATCSEELMNEYIESGYVSDESIAGSIHSRQLFPCYFGSALRAYGIDGLLEGIGTYSLQPEYKDEFSALVYKISRDREGKRLTHMKITGGSLKIKSVIGEYGKVNDIRIYSGNAYETVESAAAGSLCAVSGLNGTYSGMKLGAENGEMLPIIEPVFRYRIIISDGTDDAVMLKYLREVEEEEPELHISYDEDMKEIYADIMGEVQTDIIKRIINDRYGVGITFGNGRIVYRETIDGMTYGIGHFEPLRHYAEVHLRMEALERGSGLVFESDCSEDVLAGSWQRTVLSALEKKIHKGVLAGAEITDMKITLVTGRAHNKHTEGGDFRKAAYRALRNGLMQADNILLEPYYSYTLELPEKYIGRAMNDIERMKGTVEYPAVSDGTALMKGIAPVSLIRNYGQEVISYTGGTGKISFTLWGYERCHNQDEVIGALGYNAERDIYNTADSVFCFNGVGSIVPWYDVKKYAHMPVTGEKTSCREEYRNVSVCPQTDLSIGTEEIDMIISRAGGTNTSRRQGFYRKKDAAPVTVTYGKRHEGEKYLLVDGYNVIYAWKELSELAETGLDGARGRLLDIMCNYQAMKGINVIVVFDAYRVKGHTEEYTGYHNIHVVYTREAETADLYIERFAHDNGEKHDITVATSDGLEQIIIRGEGCRIISAREFEKEVRDFSNSFMNDYREHLT